MKPLNKSSKLLTWSYRQNCQTLKRKKKKKLINLTFLILNHSKVILRNQNIIKHSENISKPNNKLMRETM